jgi:hypothetical protein
MWESECHPPVEVLSCAELVSETNDTLVTRMREAFIQEIESAGITTEQQGVPSFNDWCAEPMTVINIPCYKRAVEEAHMRPARENEIACCNGHLCEGLLMAKYGHNSNEDDGFTLVAMPGSRYCILCLRVQTSLIYYRSVLTQDSNPPHQTHYNIIGEVGEYNASACILPSQMSFSTILPVVMHQRNLYRYENNQIYQDAQTFFRYAPASAASTASGASQTF